MHFGPICSYYASKVQVDAHVIYEALGVRSLTPSKEDRICNVSSYNVLLLVTYLHVQLGPIILIPALFSFIHDYSHIILIIPKLFWNDSRIAFDIKIP